MDAVHQLSTAIESGDIDVGIAIGLALTLIHLISIPITNTSVNPARSTGPALLEGGIALSQLWFFWVMPIIGALLAGFVFKWFEGKKKAE